MCWTGKDYYEHTYIHFAFYWLAFFVIKQRNMSGLFFVFTVKFTIEFNCYCLNSISFQFVHLNVEFHEQKFSSFLGFFLWFSLYVSLCLGLSASVATGCSTPGSLTPKPPTTLLCSSSSCSHYRSCPSKWTTSNRSVQETTKKNIASHVRIDFHTCFFYSPRTTQQSWWSSWARVQTLKVCSVVPVLSYFDKTFLLSACLTSVLSFNVRSEEVGVCARRLLDGDNPLPECLRQWQLSCWYCHIHLLIQIVYVFICVLSHWLTKKNDFFRQEKEERGQQGASTECEGTEWRRREEEGETKGSRTQPRKDSLHR